MVLMLMRSSLRWRRMWRGRVGGVLVVVRWVVRTGRMGRGGPKTLLYGHESISSVWESTYQRHAYKLGLTSWSSSESSVSSSDDPFPSSSDWPAGGTKFVGEGEDAKGSCSSVSSALTRAARLYDEDEADADDDAEALREWVWM
jgi:hypothetical protein